MLTSVSATIRLNRGAGVHHHAHTRELAVSTSALFQRSEQARTFCFGWWSGHFDREKQRELRRRHRALRKLLGEQQDRFGNNGSRAGGPCVNHDWQPRRNFAFGRYSGTDSALSSSSYFSNRTARGFPEASCGVYNNILFYDRGGKQTSPIPPKEDDRSSYIRHRSWFLKHSRFASHNQPTAATPVGVNSADEEYVIDPITNRKVFKSSKPTPNEKFLASSSNRKPFEISSNRALGFDLTPTVDEMQAYHNVILDDVESDSTLLMTSSDANFRMSKERQQPDLSVISDSNKAGYMSWKYTGMLGDFSRGVAPNHEELDKYKLLEPNERDGTNSDLQTGEEYDPGELDKYKPLKRNEPNGKPTVSQEELRYEGHDAEELKRYQPFYWNEPHGQLAKTRDLGHESYSPAELTRYKPFMHNEPDGKHAVSVLPEELGQPEYDQAEVQRYRPVMHLEPDGKLQTSVAGTEAHSPGVFDQTPDSSTTDATVSDEAYHNIYLKLGRFNFTEREKAALDPLIPFDQDRTGMQKLHFQTEADKVHDRQRLEVSASRLSAESDTIDKLASAGLKAAKKRAEKRGLRGAIEREKAIADPYSTDPQGLETAYALECDGDKASPMYIKVHKRYGTAAEVPRASEFFVNEEPSRQEVYKILAYDPTTHTVSTAEVTSTVADTASSLPPAEALLRLSKPSSFLPHFQPLRDQGFEIVSGSDNVLVFRKIQAKGSSDSNRQTTLAQSAPPAATSVGVVDKVADQHVASSTENVTSSAGHMTLDPSPRPDPSEDSKTTAKSLFKSNIRVRREEPVFSGTRMQETAGKKQNSTMGIGKRMLLGATWVGGVSYVLGLISEQLKALN